MELEYWRSIKDSSSAEAFETYLKRFPNGFFSEPAKQKIRELRAKKKEEVDQLIIRADKKEEEADRLALEKAAPPPSKVGPGGPDTVRLIRLPAGQIRDYNERMKLQTAANIPEEISIQGQVNLTLGVNEKGAILIESINESEVKVTPEERREFVIETIRGLITRTQLSPPKDRDGSAVCITGWKVSYSCELEKGKLVLRKISL
jgi:hypothetical protein